MLIIKAFFLIFFLCCQKNISYSLQISVCYIYFLYVCVATFHVPVFWFFRICHITVSMSYHVCIPCHYGGFLVSVLFLIHTIQHYNSNWARLFHVIMGLWSTTKSWKDSIKELFRCLWSVTYLKIIKELVKFFFLVQVKCMQSKRFW